MTTNITDTQGWIYASNFNEIMQLLDPLHQTIEQDFSIPQNLQCRTRKWQRRMMVQKRYLSLNLIYIK